MSQQLLDILPQILGTDIYGLQRMNPNNFDDHQTFSLGQNLTKRQNTCKNDDIPIFLSAVYSAN